MPKNNAPSRGGDKFARCADKDKIVVVVADNGNQTAGRFSLNQFVFIGQGIDARRRRKTPVAKFI